MFLLWLVANIDIVILIIVAVVLFTIVILYVNSLHTRITRLEYVVDVLESRVDRK